jgi:hypothetical protein
MFNLFIRAISPMAVLRVPSVESNHVTSTRVHDHVQGQLVSSNMYI